MTKKLQDDPVLKRLRAAVAEVYGDRLERVVLFGSRARGEAKPDSDYDIAVFIRDPASFYDESGRLAAISRRVGPSSPPRRFRLEPTGSAAGSCTNCVRTVSTYGRLARREPRIDRELTRFLATAYRLKATADYAVGPAIAPISAEQATAAIGTARRFIDTIIQLLPPGVRLPRGPGVQPNLNPPGTSHKAGGSDTTPRFCFCTAAWYG
jgi:predicted nucleotidyltransferase